MLTAYAGVRLRIPSIFSTLQFRVATRTGGALLVVVVLRTAMFAFVFVINWRGRLGYHAKSIRLI